VAWSAGAPGGPRPWTPAAPGLAVAVDWPSVDYVWVEVLTDDGDPRVAAAIELVSPRNKDRPRAREAFAAKCADYLQGRKRDRGEEAGQVRRGGSGTGPILLSQASFLLAHIANSGPVPLLASADLPGAAGLDGSSIANRGPWCDTAGLGVNSRSAPCLCRVVAGDGGPVWPPFSPCGGFGRSSESRSPASGRELAARRTIKPGGIRVLALSLTAPDPFLRIAAILSGPSLT